jgi:hypothetical protein
MATSVHLYTLRKKGNMQQAILFEVRCLHCGKLEVWGLERALRELVRAGRYRTRADFDPDMIRELFLIHADKINCPQCSQKGLSARIAPKEGWSWADETCCERCGKIIPPERLTAVPDTTLCVPCQMALERGESGDVAKYCPRCGEIMTLKPVASGGITRYEQVCPKCRPRNR